MMYRDGWWSLRDLARRAGVRPTTVSAIETRQTTGIDFATLEKPARTLEVDPAFLVVTREH